MKQNVTKKKNGLKRTKKENKTNENMNVQEQTKKYVYKNMRN